MLSAELIIQGIAAAATTAGVLITLQQIRASKRAEQEKQDRRQAENISAWMEEGYENPAVSEDAHHRWELIRLNNASNAPVYQVIITCVGIQGAGPAFRGEDNSSSYDCRRFIGLLPPGTWSTWLPTHGSRGMSIVLAAEVAFRDAQGLSWVRRADGQLIQIQEDPAQFYGLEQPIPWGGCDRLD